MSTSSNCRPNSAANEKVWLLSFELEDSWGTWPLYCRFRWPVLSTYRRNPQTTPRRSLSVVRKNKLNRHRHYFNVLKHNRLYSCAQVSIANWTLLDLLQTSTVKPSLTSAGLVINPRFQLMSPWYIATHTCPFLIISVGILCLRNAFRVVSV